MMRKNIGLFRGKCAGQWLYGYLTINGNGTCQIWENTDVGFFPAVVNPKTVSEYTGLTDKNGVKIFEGDIFEREVGDEEKKRYVVEWSHCYLGLVAKKIEGESRPIKWLRTRLDLLTPSDLEVIGNIYDNPELLGGDDHAAD